MPPILRDIRDLNAPLPEFIVLDTSLILELHPVSSSANSNHTLAVNFLNRLKSEARQTRVKPLLPLLAFEECYFKICQLILTVYGKSAGGMKWHDYYKQHPLTIRSIHPVLMQLYQTLLSFPIEIAEPEDLAIYPKGRELLLAARMGDLINQFAILPKDATILAEAERLGIYAVATLDRDWSRADGFTVFAPL